MAEKVLVVQTGKRDATPVAMDARLAKHLAAKGRIEYADDEGTPMHVRTAVITKSPRPRPVKRVTKNVKGVRVAAEAEKENPEGQDNEQTGNPNLDPAQREQDSEQHQEEVSERQQEENERAQEQSQERDEAYRESQGLDVGTGLPVDDPNPVDPRTGKTAAEDDAPPPWEKEPKGSATRRRTK